MSASETRFAILLFSDIVGSTDLKTRHGVPAYREALMVHNGHFQRIARECHGIRILQNTGDGYFAEAGSVAEAVKFAMLFQEAMRAGPWGVVMLTTRVGIHAGEISTVEVQGGSGLVGPAADLAARVMSLALGGQILLTRFPFDEARHFLREHPAVAGKTMPPLCWLAHGAYLLKGRDEPMEIFEVGAEGLAPLVPPEDGEKAKRLAKRAPASGGTTPSRKLPPVLALVAAAVLAAIAALVYFAPWKKGDRLVEAERAKPAAPPSASMATPGIPPSGPASTQKQSVPVLPAATTGPTTPDPKLATKDKPFVNTLGMKFVPVPIVSGPSAGRRVLFSIWDVRVQDYAAYAGAKNVSDWWTKMERDGIPVGRELKHPVVGVSWEDAQGFCQWLTEKESAQGKLPKGWGYRLPSDEEWSWAVGLPPESGATPAEKSRKNSVDFPWGKDWPPTRKVGNLGDEAFHARFPHYRNAKTSVQPWVEGYDDGFATTSPVGAFPANAYGLYDMDGNVQQWCEDWMDKDQKNRVARGPAWESGDRGNLLSSWRNGNVPKAHSEHTGIRCVLSESAP